MFDYVSCVEKRQVTPCFLLLIIINIVLATDYYSVLECPNILKAFFKHLKQNISIFGTKFWHFYVPLNRYFMGKMLSNFLFVALHHNIRPYQFNTYFILIKINNWMLGTNKVEFYLKNIIFFSFFPNILSSCSKKRLVTPNFSLLVEKIKECARYIEWLL